MTLRSVWDVVDGVRVHGRVGDVAHVAGGRPDVVFVHGLGMSTRYLEPTMRAAESRANKVSQLAAERSVRVVDTHEAHDRPVAIRRIDAHMFTLPRTNGIR